LIRNIITLLLYPIFFKKNRQHLSYTRAYPIF
jgi:hypothetical protein